MRVIRCWLCGLIMAAVAGSAAARSMLVSLEPADDGEPVVIANLELADDGRYQLEFRHAPFTSHFLSMRPFKCLPAPPRLQCRLDYPYKKDTRIDADDLGNLEYDLLFLVKQADEFGVDFWNGRYYRLRWDGQAIVGTAVAVDMNLLASRPAPGVTRPIDNNDMSEIAASDTPYLTLRIAPARGD